MNDFVFFISLVIYSKTKKIWSLFLGKNVIYSNYLILHVKINYIKFKSKVVSKYNFHYM